MWGTDKSRMLSTQCFTVPGKVANLEVTKASATSLTVSWNPVYGASSYIVKHRRKDRNYEEKSTVDTELTLMGLDNGHVYIICVAAVNSAGAGSFEKVKDTLTDLAPPSDLQATIKYMGDSISVDVEFTVSSQQSVVEYCVDLLLQQGETDHEEVKSKKVKTTPASFSRLPHSACCIPSVSALGENGTQSAKIYGKPIWTRPSRVEKVWSKSISGNSENISWEKVNGAVCYLVKCQKEGEEPEPEIETTDTQLNLKNLVLNTKFTVSVTAKNEGGVGTSSNSICFQTGLPPPSNIRVFTNNVDTSNFVKVEFDEPNKKPDAYEISVSGLTHPKETIVSPIISEKNRCLLRHLSPGSEYVVYIRSIDPSNAKRNSEHVQSRHFWTGPKKVIRVNMEKDSFSSRYFTWPCLSGASSYVVKIKKDGSSPIFREVEKNELHLSDLSLHSKYRLTVRGKNEGGEGDESKEVVFETALHAPRKIQVSNNPRNPTTAFDVTFKEPEFGADKYKIRVMRSRGGKDIIKYVNHLEAMSVIAIPGLEPGERYQVAVSSVHDGDESLNSEETLSKIIHTRMPALAVKLHKLSNSKYKITWNEVIDATHYKVLWKIEHNDWNEKDVKGPEYIMTDLDPGHNFEVKVAALSIAGQGQETELIKFTTVPASPKGLEKKILSTRTVEIFCNETVGASTYIFDVCGQLHERDKPEMQLQHDGEKTDFDVQVYASNHAGISLPSTSLKFNQPLLYLQKKFVRSAKHKFAKEKFITPIFTKISTKDEEKDFGTKRFYIPNGETVLILGEHFAGKTACCCQYLQDLPEDKFGVMLDWDDLKNILQDVNVKAILKQCMAGISDEDMAFVIDWMEQNSDQVVFVVDSFTLPTSFKGKKISCDDTTSLQNVLFHIVKANKEIFPESQVLCASFQSHLQQIIRPHMCLSIVGFDASRAKLMKRRIFGAECEAQRVPTHLEYFFTNPSHCENILQLLKSQNTTSVIDSESYSFMFVKSLEKILDTYPEAKRKEKLKQLLQEIKNVPQKLKTVEHDPKKAVKKSKSIDSASSFKRSSAGSITYSFIDSNNFSENLERSCVILHDCIIKAVYFAYFCSSQEFKERFHKKAIILGKNAKIWILAAGLLREKTLKFAVELFRQIDETLNEKEINKKLKFAVEFVSNNMSTIKKQLTINSQVLLDWYDVANEIGDKDLLKKCTLTVKPKESMEMHEIDEIAHFITHVRQDLYNFAEIRFPKQQLSPTKLLPIDTSLKENPYFQATFVYTSGGPSTVARPMTYQMTTRRTSNVNSNAEGSVASPNQHQDLIESLGNSASESPGKGEDDGSRVVEISELSDSNAVYGRSEHQVDKDENENSCDESTLTQRKVPDTLHETEDKQE